jgi:outer membrane lipoprotein-sorting protein
MIRMHGSAAVTATSVLALTLLASGLMSVSARADDAEAKATVDKAVKALGGEEKLNKLKAISVKSKGKLFIMGNENDFTSESISEGPSRLRSVFEAEFGGNAFKVVMVLNGDKGWRTVNDETKEIEKEDLENQKRLAYLSSVSVAPFKLKGKDFTMESAAEIKVGDKPAAGVKAKGPDGKEFTIYFDKESGLPVRLVAPQIRNFQGEEVTVEMNFSEYKDFDGVKKATKMDNKYDGEKIIELEITEFKTLDKVPANTFEEPK